MREKVSQISELILTSTEILKIMLRSENLAEDVDLKKLAEETVSFSGSDLKRKFEVSCLSS